MFNINNKFSFSLYIFFSSFLTIFFHNKSENALFITNTMAAVMSHGNHYGHCIRARGTVQNMSVDGTASVRARVLYPQQCMVFPPQKIRLMKNVNTEWTTPAVEFVLLVCA